jgi:hypothetical protein
MTDTTLVLCSVTESGCAAPRGAFVGEVLRPSSVTTRVGEVRLFDSEPFRVGV